MENKKRIPYHHINLAIYRNPPPFPELFRIQAFYQQATRIVADISLYSFKMLPTAGIPVMISIDKYRSKLLRVGNTLRELLSIGKPLRELPCP